MKTARLLRLADLLDRYPERHDAPEFDLQCWGRLETKRVWLLGLRKVRCQANACAFGLACLSGEFERDGLEYEILDDGQINPVYYGKKDWAAAALFFGLSQEEAVRLFSAVSYDGPERGVEAAKAVADRIREVVAASAPVRSAVEVAANG